MTEIITNSYKKISKADALGYLNQTKVLIMTATKIETETLHRSMQAIDGNILQVGIDTFTYYFGIFGEHLITHVQCKAGSATSNGSAVVANHAINLCRPTVLIMVGIAFGMDNKKQKIGDVLVSELLSPYEFQRLGASNDVYRGGAPKASNYLCNRFSNHVWKHSYQLTPKGKLLYSKVISGMILSGEKLIDDPEVKAKLKQQFPEAIGGEMEGSGLAASAEVSKTEWIIVKGICDFADGNKSKNKNLYQFIAARAAVDYCRSALSEPYILEELGVESKPQSDPQSTSPNINEVLFRRYSKASEKFYLQREIDSDFNDFLPSYSLWLFGLSGAGKSTVIMRNLLRSGYQVVQIYLAIGSQTGIQFILWEILSKLRLHFDIITENDDILSSEASISAISGLILANFDFSSHIIYLDEIPEYKDNSIFSDFCQSLYAINEKVNNVRSDVKFLFVLSSITSPQEHLNDSQRKIRESFKFVKLGEWNNTDMEKLLEILQKGANLELLQEESSMMITGASGSPRDLKRIIRDYLSTRNRPSYSLTRIIKEIEQERK